jgi:hypothetical protein
MLENVISQIDEQIDDTPEASQNDCRGTEGNWRGPKKALGGDQGNEESKVADA